MDDAVLRISEAADQLLLMLDNVVDVSLKEKRRAATAISIISAVVVVNHELQVIVTRLLREMNADGIQIVILDEDTAHVVVIAGAEVIESQILDENCSAPAADSYCKFTVTMSVPFIVVDAKKEPALKGNPYIELVRGYIGGVLTVQKSRIGALCAVTDKPRSWTDEENLTIHKAAVEVSAILEEALLLYG